ncbi:hypothetical protein ACFLU5_14930 [Bacteroidota bacterium]
MKRIETLLLIIFTVSINSFSQSNDKITRMEAIHDFPILKREGQASNRKSYGPFNIEDNINALAGDDLNFTFHMASAEGVFPGKAGVYTLCLNTLTERDGECVYNVYVNDKPVGLFQQNPPTNEFHAPATLQWTGVDIPSEAKIRVESNNWSNLKRHELNFFEYARGRWTGVDFIPEKSGDKASQHNLNIGIFEEFGDVGSADIPAKASYHKIEQAFYLAAAGEGIGRYRDDFGYLWKTSNSDFELEALVTLIGLTEDKDRKAGLIIRQSTQPDAPFVACVVQGDGDVSLQYRKGQGADTGEILFNVHGAEMIQLVKKGNTFTMSASKFGDDYERQSIELTEFKGSLKAGFFVCSNSAINREIVRFSHIRFVEDIHSEGK